MKKFLSPRMTILTGIVASIALIATLTTVSHLSAQPKGPPPRDADRDEDRDDDDRPPPPRRPRGDDDREERGPRGPRGHRPPPPPHERDEDDDGPRDHGPRGHRPPPPPHERDDDDGPRHMGGPMGGRMMGRRGPGGPEMDFLMMMHPDRPMPTYEHLRRAARELEKVGRKDQAAALNKEADAAEEQFRKEHPPGGPGMVEVQKTVAELKTDVQTLRKQLEEVRAELQKLKESAAPKKAATDTPATPPKGNA